MNASPPHALALRPMLGIGLKVVSVTVFVGMQTTLKALGPEIPAGQLVFFRSFFALVPVLAYLCWLGTLRTAFHTRDIGGHFIRGAIGVTSMAFGFYAIGRLPYPEWITISYASPLLTVVFAAIFLREHVGRFRWTAVLVGLCGIVVVIAPNLSLDVGTLSGAQRLGMIASLAGAAFAAVAMIQVRRLVRTEPTTTIVVYFSICCSVIALVSLPFGWVWPSPWQASLLVLAGIFGGIGQLLLTACYRYAEASTIAPFEYTSMLMAVAIGAALFGEVASPTTLLGGAIVVSAGVFIILREHRLGIERKRARSVSPPQN
ncbi:DMT family transporter [Aureimonas sp. AU22]|uniref:DMT family transporter n=1 Tax=Aureimonas sp. AU22 TaxID=1638162 RepID=UPI0007849AAC|nr:DMT family transporter [Aureimonas sp. AU22]